MIFPINVGKAILNRPQVYHSYIVSLGGNPTINPYGARLSLVLTARNSMFPKGPIGRDSRSYTSLRRWAMKADEVQNCSLPEANSGRRVKPKNHWVQGNNIYPLVNVYIANYGKSQCLMGKSLINGQFSIAMLNYRRVIQQTTWSVSLNTRVSFKFALETIYYCDFSTQIKHKSRYRMYLFP